MVCATISSSNATQLHQGQESLEIIAKARHLGVGPGGKAGP